LLLVGCVDVCFARFPPFLARAVFLGWLLRLLPHSFHAHRVRQCDVVSLILAFSQCLLCNVLESSIDIDGVSSRGLEESDIPIDLTPTFCCCCRDGALRRIKIVVDFVSEKDEGLLAASRDKFLHPRREVLERLLVGDVEDEDAGLRAAKISSAQRLKSLLTCGVPQLQRHSGAIDSHVLGDEVRSDGRFVPRVELAVYEALEQVGFADSSVTENSHLDHLSLATTTTTTTPSCWSGTYWRWSCHGFVFVCF